MLKKIILTFYLVSSFFENQQKKKGDMSKMCHLLKRIKRKRNSHALMAKYKSTGICINFLNRQIKDTVYYKNVVFFYGV